MYVFIRKEIQFAVHFIKSLSYNREILMFIMYLRKKNNIVLDLKHLLFIHILCIPWYIIIYRQWFPHINELLVSQ